MPSPHAIMSMLRESPPGFYRATARKCTAGAISRPGIAPFGSGDGYLEVIQLHTEGCASVFFHRCCCPPRSVPTRSGSILLFACYQTSMKLPVAFSLHIPIHIDLLSRTREQVLIPVEKLLGFTRATGLAASFSARDKASYFHLSCRTFLLL